MASSTARPPQLPGYTFLRVAGAGGSSDVFLFEQHSPRREVAIKVLRTTSVSGRAVTSFRAEAELMGTLGAHPSILSVHLAGVAPDGRPFLVMEPCVPSLGERYRRERIPVAEVLRTAILIGGALESAHRAGVLHRDVKPSNILLNAHGSPVLADFGIASRVRESIGGAPTLESVGVSVPWAAPEVLLEETTGTVASEVWSYGATVYSLLAGHSPFEVRGESNRLADIVARILRASPGPTDRGDVPPSLEAVLRTAMSREPAARQPGIEAVVRQFREVEAELGLDPTPVDVRAPLDTVPGGDSIVWVARERGIVAGAVSVSVLVIVGAVLLLRRRFRRQ